jgi:hypothetical protein
MDDRQPDGEETIGDERSADRLLERRVGDRHVIASFVDVRKARVAARQLRQGGTCKQVRLAIRSKGPVAEGESPEELADMDVKWLEGAAVGALIGAAVGAVFGAVVAAVLWLTDAASVVLSFALTVPIAAVFGAWILGLIGGFGKTWDMSYRDSAMDGQAVVTVDTDDATVADEAFTMLLHTDAQVVEEFERGERLRLEVGAGASVGDNPG